MPERSAARSLNAKEETAVQALGHSFGSRIFLIKGYPKRETRRPAADFLGKNLGKRTKYYFHAKARRPRKKSHRVKNAGAHETFFASSRELLFPLRLVAILQFVNREVEGGVPFLKILRLS
jgi:hypothetical protein